MAFKSDVRNGNNNWLAWEPNIQLNKLPGMHWFINHQIGYINEFTSSTNRVEVIPMNAGVVCSSGSTLTSDLGADVEVDDDLGAEGAATGVGVGIGAGVGVVLGSTCEQYVQVQENEEHDSSCVLAVTKSTPS